MEVNPTVPVKTVLELIAYAKGRPGKLNYASAGIGTPQNLCGELFKMLTGVDIVHVPYRGAAPAVTDMIAGQVQLMFDNLTSSLEHIRAGRLRALAMTSSKRWSGFAELPTVGDFVPGAAPLLGHDVRPQEARAAVASLIIAIHVILNRCVCSRR
jgi:tripartite-type tricarboxylate transporter receptor subunit TctC